MRSENLLAAMVALALGVSGSVGIAPPGGTGQAPPNIVLIYVDDLGRRQQRHRAALSSLQAMGKIREKQFAIRGSR